MFMFSGPSVTKNSQDSQKISITAKHERSFKAKKKFLLLVGFAISKQKLIILISLVID